MTIKSKKIFLFFIILIISLFSVNNIYAIWVDEVFTDITKDYKYYDELQNLYDKGIIKDNVDGFFFSDEPLRRDDFVWVVSEVSCNKCIYPNTPANLVSKYYGDNIFFDLNNLNKNYYCIADMADKWFVKWYNAWYACADWTQSESESPFCASNYVTKEEAIAVLLRSSNIFTVEDNSLVKQKIASWDIKNNLSSDVIPIENGVVNTFYWYIQKALDYSFTEKKVWEDWTITEKKYYLLEKEEDNKIYPNKPITREEYIKMAYVIFRKNSCSFARTNVNNVSSQINFLWWECSEDDKSCPMGYASWKKYDFNAQVATVCQSWIKDYKWVFNYLWQAKNPYKKIFNTQYVDNYEFKDNTGKLLEWNWNITLEIQDNCGDTSTINKSVYISDKTDFSAEIMANPKIWKATLVTDFEAKIYWNVWNVSYTWVFWDWNTAVWRVVQNAYKNPWFYDATVFIEDKETWNKIKDTVVIQVLWENETSEILTGDKLKTVSENYTTNNNSENNSENSYNNGENIGDTDNESINNNSDNTNNSLNSSLNNSSENNNSINSNSDIDKDWILDKDDDCVSVFWVKENNWCPIFSRQCTSNSDCSKWKMCDINAWYCVLDTDWDKVPDSNDNCRLTPWLINNFWCPAWAIWENCYLDTSDSWVCGAATCNSCPCDNTLDFKADFRKCDLVFPTILSPDGKDIYAKWENKIIEN